MARTRTESLVVEPCFATPNGKQSDIRKACCTPFDARNPPDFDSNSLWTALHLYDDDELWVYSDIGMVTNGWAGYVITNRDRVIAVHVLRRSHGRELF